MASYFIHSADRQGTCYYEFYAGPWSKEKMEFWHKDSICISDDNFTDIGFEKSIAEVVEAYDPYGITAVTQSEWDKIMQIATEAGGELLKAAQEASEWTKENFSKHDVFTILGL